MSEIKYNSIDPDNIFGEEESIIQFSDENVIKKQTVDNIIINSFLDDVKRFSIKCQDDELDMDDISKEIDSFIKVMLCGKYKDYIIHPLEVLPVVRDFIDKYNNEMDDTFKSCIPILTSYHIMREIYYNINVNASDFDDITADGVEDILKVLSTDSISTNILSSVELQKNLCKIDMMMTKKTIAINLGIGLIKLSKYDIYSTLKDYGIKINWNIIKYLQMDEYVNLMDLNEMVVDYDSKDTNNKTLLEVTPLFKHSTPIFRPYYEFIIELIKDKQFDVNKTWVNDEYTYTPFSKDILFSSIFYLNDTFLKTTDLEDEEITRLYIYASKLLNDEELV